MSFDSSKFRDVLFGIQNILDDFKHEKIIDDISYTVEVSNSMKLYLEELNSQRNVSDIQDNSMNPDRIFSFPSTTQPFVIDSGPTFTQPVLSQIYQVNPNVINFKSSNYSLIPSTYTRGHS